MDEGMVLQVRRFNRVVTQRVGALEDRYLARGRPLGEARVLWEIGDDGCDIRSLRSRLGLDSGYLSRLLRSLEAADLVTVGPSARDRRVRTAQLTSSGRAERALLDQRSDELAQSFLAPLDKGQRDRLVTAMGEVERLLTAAMVEMRPVDPADPDAQHCLGEYFAELDRRFDTGFEASTSVAADVDELSPPAGLFLVAMLRAEPIGCGALKFDEGEPTEIKRLWVAPSARGLGIGRRLLTELETRARDHGSRAVRLDTNRTLSEAIALYRSAGYYAIDRFNDQPYAHHWFQKDLDAGRQRSSGEIHFST
jgi:DNA-binding MarR family transcriptional regulator/GNAT superfamily N-acetyltransferase